MTNRRTLLAALAGAVIATAMRAHAQPRPLRVAFILFTSPRDSTVFFEALRHGFRELGYVEGATLIVEPYFADESRERLGGLVAQAIASAPHLIISQGFAVNAVYAAKPPMPVVFAFSGDPIEAGFVQSLAHPGGRMTGITLLALELVGKRMEILKEVMPGLRRVAVLAAPQHPGDKAERRASETAATALGISTVYFEARNANELETAMSAIEKAGCDAVVMFPVQYVITQRERIAAWAIRTRLPTISGWAQFAEGGNLLSYGPNLRDCVARLAYFADRIAKGTSPAAIPVELPTRVEFVLNQKAAKALGINVPRVVELRADRVIT
jgi:putative ABC transport system substrate-binding protein